MSASDSDSTTAPGPGTELFRLPARGVLEVRGADRIRWLDGMLSQDVKALASRGRGAVGHALLLTQQGRIVSDLYVLVDETCVWLEGERDALPGVTAHLEKYIIADDVTLSDASERVARLALEGPDCEEVLRRAAGEAPALAAGAWGECSVAGVAVRAAAYALLGGAARQLFVPAEAADAVARALLAAGAPVGLAEGDAEGFERRRVEAGVPRAGRELDESVLPAEARLLESAVSFRKGCYTGQEVVARLHSRGRRNHLLVGLRFAGLGAALPAKGTALQQGGRRVGEVTSAVESRRFGAIGLGFVRHEYAEPGTRLNLEGGEAQVAALPFEAGASGRA